MTAALYSDAVWTDLPAGVIQSKLYLNGGALILPDLPGAAAVDQLESEALLVRSTGWRNEVTCCDVVEERGGSPSRCFAGAHARGVQWSVFSADALVAALSAACGVQMAPTGGGTYSYYERPGDFLALHRDIFTCDLTVVTCLRETCLRETAPAADAGVLLVYAQHINRPLHSARQAGRQAARAVAIRRGESAALLGAVVPHEVTSMLPGQERIVSVMCYRVPGLS